MIKKIILCTMVMAICLPGIGAHITGGEMVYEYLGPGNVAGSKKYRITLRLFRDNLCTGCAAMPTNVYIGIFNHDNGQQVNGTFFDVPRIDEFQVPVNPLPECVNNAPLLSYNVAIYNLVVELPGNNLGYTAAYQTCCRVNPLANVFNTNGGGGSGSTYSCELPGSIPGGGNNSSPRFSMAIDLICYNKPFTLNFNAIDPDGDSLSYSFCPAFDGGNAQGAANINPAPPPYGSVTYINGFNSFDPLGPMASIDPRTGVISGIAPDAGKYVVCVCINEFRNGVLIGRHRKDFIVNVATCDFAGAELPANISACDSYTQTFVNLNNSPENETYFWDFGVPGMTNDTSIQQSPTFTYPDTGVYTIKLVVNRGRPCSDSTTAQVYVFPDFNPGFIFQGLCIDKPTRFTDTTTATYGVVNSWQWDFGVNFSSGDTSREQNPEWTYLNIGNYNVRLIVGSSKGCLDTVIKSVPILDKPPLTMAFSDTLICSADDLQLEAIGDGIFSWTPLTNITGANTATPVVSPQVTTTYYVQLDDNGCLNNDSVKVRVVDFVTLTARADTVICEGDSLQLGGVTDGLRFEWSPPETISDPTLLTPFAQPTSTTTYTLTSFIGSCEASDDVTVTLVPYPVADAGNDTTICYLTPAFLNGSIVGSSFSWAPASTLDDPASLTPTASPFQTTTYILTVTDTRGCPKPGRDTVVVTMLPEIPAFAGNDTAVIAGQPLQLLASGGSSYLWSPPFGLSAIDIPNPIATLFELDTIRYRVYVTEGICTDSAYIRVSVFKTAPSVFVPSAFTPNGDGLNDLLRPIAVGMKEIEYFRIYNRWGQLVFDTRINGQGWDGRINGQLQGTNTYVWLVKATDFMDRPYFLKGTVTLIR